MAKKEITNVEKLIYLMLNHRSAINDFMDKGLNLNIFNDEHKFIIQCILEQFNEFNSLLTLNVFNEKLNTFKNTVEKVKITVAYGSCSYANCQIDDFSFILSKIIEENSRLKLNDALDKFRKEMNKESFEKPIKKLYLSIGDIIDSFSSENKENDFYDNMHVLSKDYIEYIKNVREGKIEEEKLILTGIPEIDETMATGLEKGTLTIFVSDIGSFKSTIMLNIALNVWESGYNVLHVPIEMDRHQMMRRAMARQTRIPSGLLLKDFKKLTPEQMEKIDEYYKKDIESESKFYIMQMSGGTSIKKIQYKIEKDIEKFHPKLVVVDYIANLEADKNRYGRNDLEIGDMLKGLRQMGKDNNFAVISAAQLGRDALRKVRANLNSDTFQVNSEDIRGSHEYAADADNIYVIVKNPAQPNELLYIFPLKCRNGSTLFSDESNRATLEVYPSYGLIQSMKSSNASQFDEEFNEIVDDVDSNKDILVNKENETADDDNTDIINSIEDINDANNESEW